MAYCYSLKYRASKFIGATPCLARRRRRRQRGVRRTAHRTPHPGSGGGWGGQRAQKEINVQ